ncbi:MAG TPA: cytochrome P460 family protein [Terriglobales bacterium]|nr:cytochrome P460 family protein [Terriglobales bacterium]
MRNLIVPILTVIVVVTVVAVHGGEVPASFSPYVDATGNISIPRDYRNWTLLGSWHLAPGEGEGDAVGAAGFHNVYVPPGAVESYRKTGKFPDGTVIVKELLKSETGDLTTGKVSWATEVEGWFIMVKDDQGRFPNNPRWGGGWGWVLFNSSDPMKTVTRNWRTDCLGCHTPAKQTDWVFVQGYPILSSESPLGKPGQAAAPKAE